MFVIVYGTLKKGGSLHGHMKDAEYIEDVEVSGFRMYDTGFGYPAVVESAEHSFYGELYKVSEDILTRLDRVESVESGLFKRKMVSWADVISKSLAEDAVIYVSGRASVYDVRLKQPIDSGFWGSENGINVVNPAQNYILTVFKNIKSQVTQIYAYTEGVNRDLNKSALIDQLKHVSLSVEEIGTYIDNIILTIEDLDE